MKIITGERTAIFRNSFPFIIDLFHSFIYELAFTDTIVRITSYLFFLCLHNHELIWNCFLSAIGSNVFNRPFYRIFFFLLLPTIQLFLECICIFFLFSLLIILFCCSTYKTMRDFIWFYIFAIFLIFFPNKHFLEQEIKKTDG